jgi:E3 ubiquitin-protein ligase HUWE1
MDKYRTPSEQEAPDWVGPALLVLDSLTQLPFPSKDEDLKDRPPSIDIQPILPTEQQHLLLKVCLGLLKARLNSASTSALLLLCSRLTRNYELSTIFLQQGGVDLLLHLNDASHMSLITAILRHLIEDPTTLETAMEAEISNTVTVLSARPGAKVQPKPFLNQLAGVVCRDPAIFMQAATNTCRFQPGTTNIILNKPQKAAATSQAAPSTATGSTTTTTSTSTTSTTATEKSKTTKRTPPNLKQVVLTLLDYLLERPALEKKADQEATKQPITSVHVLQLLSRFVVSYAGCSHLILKHKSPQSKGATNILTVLLRDLLPYPSPSGDKQLELQNQMTTKLVASLCSRAEGRRRVISELSAVLEQQVGSLKVNPSAVYSIRSIGDLVVLLLTSQSRAEAGLSTEMAKLMLEEKIPRILADAMKKIDMNRPDISDIANSILKPLEALGKIAASIAAKPKEKEEETTAMDQASALQTSDVVDEIVLNTDALNQSATEFDMETATGEENEENEEEQEEG